MHDERGVIEVVPDLQFCNLVSFVSCAPMTVAGMKWLDKNVGEAGPVIIEHRYLEDIVLAARAEGLICHG